MSRGQARRQQVRQAAKAQRRTRRQQAAAARQRNRRHNAKAWGLKGATRFTDDAVLGDPVQVVELFKQLAPGACHQLILRTTRKRERGVAGANRMEGKWALVFFAHIMTGNPDWQSWYNDHQSSKALWKACGFEELPSYQTLWLRFGELETERYVAAFTDAANYFIRIAARCEPRALRFFHTDGTPAHSHMQLEHACPSEAYCKTRSGHKPAQVIARAPDEDISTDRHARSADAPDADPNKPPDNKVDKLSDAEAQALGLKDWRRSRYFRFGKTGHIMRCRDKDVGVRVYSAGPRSKKKAWIGGYFLPAVCDFFWAPTAVHFFEADIQEHLGVPELHKKVARALGDDPDRPKRITGYVADRAFMNQTFIDHNTNRGIASITPERKLPGGKPFESIRSERWDEHGPRCKHCGGPSAPPSGPGEGFVLTGTGDPRIRFRCAIGWTGDCKKIQAISCRKETRALLPIARTEMVFHDLLHSHSTFEGVFDAWRDRYAVSGTSQATRSKRRYSIAAQKLRAAAALLAEWFRICLRQGYVGAKTTKTKNTRDAIERNGGAKGLIKVRTHRAEHGLELPYGPVAGLPVPPLTPKPPPKPPPKPKAPAPPP